MAIYLLVYDAWILFRTHAAAHYLWNYICTVEEEVYVDRFYMNA